MVLNEETLLEYKKHLLPELSSNFCLNPDLNWVPCNLAHEILFTTVRRDELSKQYRKAKAKEQKHHQKQSTTSDKPKSLFSKIKGRFRQDKLSNQSIEASQQETCNQQTQLLFDQAHQAEVETMKLLAIAYVSGLSDQSSVRTLNGIPVSINNRSLKDFFFGFPDEPRYKTSQRAMTICRIMQKLKIEP